MFMFKILIAATLLFSTSAVSSEKPRLSLHTQQPIEENYVPTNEDKELISRLRKGSSLTASMNIFSYDPGFEAAVLVQVTEKLPACFKPYNPDIIGHMFPAVGEGLAKLELMPEQERMMAVFWIATWLGEVDEATSQENPRFCYIVRHGMSETFTAHLQNLYIASDILAIKQACDPEPILYCIIEEQSDD